MTSPVSRPVATVVGCKRPALPLSPEFDIKDIKEEEDDDEFTPCQEKSKFGPFVPRGKIDETKTKEPSRRT